MDGSRARRQAWQTVRGHWPNHEASRFVAVGQITWHVQIMGDSAAPTLLLLHGTGASAHSYRDLMPMLAERFQVVVPDLPGHGFTAAPRRDGLSLPGMAQAVLGLLKALQMKPAIAVGHSAGAAILLYMAGRYGFSPQAIVSVNGALEPMHGNALYAPLARLLFINPLVPQLFALRAQFGDLSDIILSKTGSQIDDIGKACYRSLFQSSGHVSGALGMMANWDLIPLQELLPDLRVPVILIAAADDRTVSAAVSRRAAERIPGARFFSIPHGGHLLHEVSPETIAHIVFSLEQDTGQRPGRNGTQS